MNDDFPSFLDRLLGDHERRKSFFQRESKALPVSGKTCVWSLPRKSKGSDNRAKRHQQSWLACDITGQQRSYLPFTCLRIREESNMRLAEAASILGIPLLRISCSCGKMFPCLSTPYFSPLPTILCFFSPSRSASRYTDRNA